MESSFKNRNIETMFARILGKLERIEEAFYSDFVERVNTADNEIIKGKRLEFESMDDFLSSMEK